MSVLGALVPNGRPLVVVSIFLGAISNAPRSWEVLRDSKVIRLWQSDVPPGTWTLRQTFSLGSLHVRFNPSNLLLPEL